MNNKIEKAFLQRLMENGGHWVELTMKATGKKIYVQRAGFSSFEKPQHDKFSVSEVFYYEDGGVYKLLLLEEKLEEVVELLTKIK